MSEIIPLDIEQELKSSYLSYSMSVIVNRAIPDVRDGLKPVHRRILYGMYTLKLLWNSGYKKAANVVGDVMAKYHPHGDSSIYDALVRMAQDFSLRAPIIDGQGNFGSVDGDPPAAMRYTEVKLHHIAKFLLDDLQENSVDFRPNYDNSEEEPVVLPAKFPNILVNGSAGVAVGMATNIPTHNLAEVIDACKLLIENQDANTGDFLRVIKGPDFPTGGQIVGDEGIKSAFDTGRGTIILRSKAHFEENENGKPVIIVDEIPYQVNKAKLIESIALLVKDKKIDGISDLRDESNKDGIRVVIEIKRGFSADVVLNQLFRMTQLQISYSTNLMVLNKMRPTLMSLKDVLSAFIDHRKEVVTRRTEFRLEKAREKANALVAIYVAILNIDEVIEIIKKSSDSKDALQKLLSRSWTIDKDLSELIETITNISIGQEKYRLSDNQAKAILEIKLQRITSFEKNQLKTEINKEIEIISQALKILGSQAALVKVIVDELNQIKENFKEERKTEILYNASASYQEEDLIEKEEVVITVTISGYIKRVTLSNYRVQKRGGKGKVAQNIKTEDHLCQIFVLSTHDEILFFSTEGKVYKIKAYKLPAGEPQSRGRAIVNIFDLKQDEKITSILPLKQGVKKDNLIFLTALGKIKRNLMTDFDKIPAGGKIAIKLSDDDKLVSVRACDPSDSIFISTKNGKSIRFLTKDLRVFKSRGSEGVKALSLAQKDEVISLSILNNVILDQESKAEYMKTPFKKRIKNPQNSDEQFILTVTENGYGKITSSYEYRLTSRSGVGIINISTSKRNGCVVASFVVDLENDIMLITNKGQVIRIKANTISVLGRNTQGVKLFKLKEAEKIASVTEVAQEDQGIEE